ncbi:MAG: nucleotide exchange factor GrpE [Candidatus Micrarchaeia archaeon]
MSEEGKNNQDNAARESKERAASNTGDTGNEDNAEAKSAAKSEKEIAELKDRLLRLAAEFDNYKKRTKNDVESAKKVGKAELAKSLLPVLDEFELAMLALNGSAHNHKDTTSGNGDSAITRGIAMVYSNFVDTLKKEGITEVKTDGVFDPYVHEIVMVKESGNEDGTILEVVKKGYRLDNILIRPASVIVSKKAQGQGQGGKQVEGGGKVAEAGNGSQK